LASVDCVLENMRIWAKSRGLERPAGKMISSNYRVGDALIRIKNACLAGASVVSVTNTKIIKAVVAVLVREKFVESVTVDDQELKLKLRTKKGKVVISDIVLISKPGRRMYVTLADLKSKKGVSTLILSTSKGMKSGKEAIKESQGGELVAEVS